MSSERSLPYHSYQNQHAPPQQQLPSLAHKAEHYNCTALADPVVTCMIMQPACLFGGLMFLKRNYVIQTMMKQTNIVAHD